MRILKRTDTPTRKTHNTNKERADIIHVRHALHRADRTRAHGARDRPLFALKTFMCEGTTVHETPTRKRATHRRKGETAIPGEKKCCGTSSTPLAASFGPSRASCNHNRSDPETSTTCRKTNDLWRAVKPLPYLSSTRTACHIAFIEIKRSRVPCGGQIHYAAHIKRATTVKPNHNHPDNYLIVSPRDMK